MSGLASQVTLLRVAGMKNKRMAEKLLKGTALDVQDIGQRHEGSTTVFVLREYKDGFDYCDSRSESWIWSIGRRKSDGIILASLDGRFHGHPEFDLLWLR